MTYDDILCTYCLFTLHINFIVLFIEMLHAIISKKQIKLFMKKKNNKGINDSKREYLAK